MQTEVFYETFDDILLNPKRFVLVCHVNPDGDAIGSMLAMGEFLRLKGHEVKAICPNAFPDFLAWMPGAADILVFEKEAEACKTAIAEAEAIMMLDFNNLARTAVLHNEIGKTRCPRIMVDHHIDPDLEHVDCYYSETKVSSASEIVAEIVLHYGEQFVTEGVATNLIVGIMTDTGCFSHSIYHPRTFELMSKLVDKAMPYKMIHEMVYDSFTEGRLRLLGYAIGQKMEVMKDYAVAIISLSQEEMDRFDFQPGDTEGIVNFPLSMKKIKMSVLITERPDQIRLSFRSKGTFSVNDLANKHFKGGGHTNAAGGSATKIGVEATASLLKDIVPEYEELRYDE
jgi:phosphoesterase RecJ-like protein